MLEPKIALMRQIVFTHAARRLTDSLYTQIIVEGKIDDQLAEIEPCVFAALGCKDPATVGAECLKSAMADMKDSVQIGFDRAEQKMLECTNEVKAVGAKVDAVDKKVSKLRKSGKSRGRYTKEARELCWSCWTSAVNHEEVWRSVNTRITYEAVFNYCRARLERVGVKSVEDYEKIIRAEIKRRSRELAAKQTAAENGIIRGMKKNAKPALALALAIAGAFAAPLRSEALQDIFPPAADHLNCGACWLLRANPRGGIFSFCESRQSTIWLKREIRNDVAEI